MTSMFQVCGHFRGARVFIINRRPDEIFGRIAKGPMDWVIYGVTAHREVKHHKLDASGTNFGIRTQSIFPLALRPRKPF
jgi:hypothetical protein